MQPATCLVRLQNRFDRRLRRLYASATTVADVPIALCDQTLAYVTIEAFTTWANFSREFYLSCAVMRPKTISGSRVLHQASDITDKRSALLRSIKRLKRTQEYDAAANAPRIPPRFEPAWHEKRTLLILSSDLELSNNASIVTGLSYPTSVFAELPTIRHFYAHRSQNTANKVATIAARQYRLRSLQHPGELINVTHAGRAQTLLAEWLSDMRAIGKALCT